MNKKLLHKLIIPFALLITGNLYGNIKLIDINKIDNSPKYIAHYSFIKENISYYDHWIQEWNYHKSKDEIVKGLDAAYKDFSTLKPNTETLLLLGDVAHYLYNLDQRDYYDLAVKNYKAAIENDPKEYRGYWFLAFHYAQANVPISAVEYFLKAQELLTSQPSADFWDEYATTMAMVNMPSHSIFGMDKARSILGTEANFEFQLGEVIRKRIVDVNSDLDYKKEDIWQALKGDKISFISRPLGIKILADSTWNISVNDYIKHQSFFTIVPTTIKNKKGKEITYTIAILMKVVNDKDNLDDYLNLFVNKSPHKNRIQFSDKFEKAIAYEITDKTMYKDLGGGHTFVIGIERKMPEYPGLLLESPFSAAKGKPGKVNYYHPLDSKNRFKGRIFYMIMLDTCEDIYEQSFTVLKYFFDNQLVIE